MIPSRDGLEFSITLTSQRTARPVRGKARRQLDDATEDRSRSDYRSDEQSVDGREDERDDDEGG